jgi:hypothetical protein
LNRLAIRPRIAKLGFADVLQRICAGKLRYCKATRLGWSDGHVLWIDGKNQAQGSGLCNVHRLCRSTERGSRCLRIKLSKTDRRRYERCAHNSASSRSQASCRM